MGYSGYLIKLGNTILPNNYIKIKSYTVIPQQTMEWSAERTMSGLLVRSTVSHKPTKITFSTPRMVNRTMTSVRDVPTFWGYFTNAFTDEKERKLKVTYYEPQSDSYKTGDFYVPDISYPIEFIDQKTNLIHYGESNISLIEY